MTSKNGNGISIRRPTSIMMQAVNLEFEGKTAEAVRLLDQHRDESSMHSEEYLMQFFEGRQAKGLGPYPLNDSGPKKARKSSKARPAAVRRRAPAPPRRVKGPRPGSRGPDAVVDSIDESAGTALLVRLEARIQELLCQRDPKEVEKVRRAMKDVQELQSRLANAMKLLEG